MHTFLKGLTLSVLFSIQTFAIDYQTYIQQIPKTELHTHLGGSYPVEFLETIATPEQINLLKLQAKKIAEGIGYEDAFKIFGTIAQIVNTDEKVKQGTYAYCQSLKNDGVVYAEIRTGLKDLGNGLEGYLKSVLDGINAAQSDNFHVRLLLSLQRSSSETIAKQTVDLALKFKDQGIVGIDLSGISTQGNVENILAQLLRAKHSGLYLTVHMGETTGEKDQMILLKTLNPDRIGHGVFLDDAARQWILDRKIPVEVCLTSSLLVGMTDKFTNHPWLKDGLEGHPISICTDDPLIFSVQPDMRLSIC